MADGTPDQLNQTNLYAMMRDNRVVWDFMLCLVARKFEALDSTLTATKSPIFSKICARKARRSPPWSDATLNKARQVLTACLANCGMYNRKTEQLVPLFLDFDLVDAHPGETVTRPRCTPSVWKGRRHDRIGFPRFMSFELIRWRSRHPYFREGKGLGNEVPFFVFSYDAKKENEVREHTEELLARRRRRHSHAIVHFDLWISSAPYASISKLRRPQALGRAAGHGCGLQQIRELAMPEDYVSVMAYRDQERIWRHGAGRDVVLITGVGKVYPFTRAHDILETRSPS